MNVTMFVSKRSKIQKAILTGLVAGFVASTLGLAIDGLFAAARLFIAFNCIGFADVMWFNK